MKYPMYCIRDLKSEFFSPRIEMNEASAKRNFAMMVNSSDNLMNFSPGDFELYYIGEFDSSVGKVNSIDIPEFIIRASDLVGVNYA